MLLLCKSLKSRIIPKNPKDNFHSTYFGVISTSASPYPLHISGSPRPLGPSNALRSSGLVLHVHRMVRGCSGCCWFWVALMASPSRSERVCGKPWCLGNPWKWGWDGDQNGAAGQIGQWMRVGVEIDNERWILGTWVAEDLNRMVHDAHSCFMFWGIRTMSGDVWWCLVMFGDVWCHSSQVREHKPNRTYAHPCGSAWVNLT